MVTLGMRLMELIAISMGITAQRFEEFFKDHTSSVNLNRYPPCPSPELALGVGHHKDPGVFTTLAQDVVGGLEVRRKPDGPHPMPTQSIWEMFFRFGAMESMRVYSIPFFFNPSHYTMVEPLPELIDGHQKAAKYRPYNWGKFALTRKRSNFMMVHIQNIQIHHFQN